MICFYGEKQIDELYLNWLIKNLCFIVFFKCEGSKIIKKEGKSIKLDIKAFTLASGIACGIFSLIVALFVVLTGRGLQFMDIIAPFHPGYTPTVLGAVISAFWMLIYGLIVGAVFAYIYNYFAKE